MSWFAGESKAYIHTQQRKHSTTLSVWNLWCHKNPLSGREAAVTWWQQRSEGCQWFGKLALNSATGVVEPCPHSEFDLRVVCLFFFRAAGVFPDSGVFCLRREVHLSVIEPSFFFAAVWVPTVDIGSECWGSAHVGVVVPRFFFSLRTRRLRERL